MERGLKNATSENMPLLKKCEYASSQAGNLKMAMEVTACLQQHSNELTSGGNPKFRGRVNISKQKKLMSMNLIAQ